MGAGNLDVSGVSGAGPYTLTVDSTTGVTVGDDVGCPLAAGGSGGFSVTGIPDGTTLTVTAKTDALGATFGAPGTTGTGSDNAWYSTPTSEGNIVVPEGAPGGSWAWAEQIPASSEPLPGVCQARLSVSSTDPLGEAASVGTVYLLPFQGNKVHVWDGSDYVALELADAGLSITLSGLTASKVYDVWGYSNSGVLALETLVWTDDTTRATALDDTDGVQHKSGDQTRMYLGSFRTDASKQVTFDTTERAVWNEYNAIPFESVRRDTTDTWTYTTDAWRQANGSTSNSIPILIGRSREALDAQYYGAAVWSVGSGGARVGFGIGIDSSTVNSANVYGGFCENVHASSFSAVYRGKPAEGYRDLRMLERTSAASGTVTWYGDGGEGTTGVFNFGLVVTSEH